MSAPLSWPWTAAYPPSVEWGALLPARPVCELLDEAARDYPDAVFIDFLGKTYTYLQTLDIVRRTARGLQDLGVQKGDRVGLFLPNTPYYVFLYYAALRIGAVVVNFNPLYAAPEVEHQILDSGCRLMATVDMPLTYDKLKPLVERGLLEKVIICRMVDVLPWPLALFYPLVKRRDIRRVPADAAHMDFFRLIANKGDVAPVAIDPHQDLAVLQYTGGTTGTPKGAMLSHANLSVNVEQARRWFPNTRRGREVMLGVLPFFHVFAMTVVLNVTVLLAGKILMLPRFDLKYLIRTIHKKRPTLFPAVPTIYTAITLYKKLGRYNLRSIRSCISGGAPLPVEIKHAFESLTGCVLVEGYGLSETSPIVCANPAMGVNKEGSIGLPLPGTCVEIVSMEDRRTVLPQGQTGELCVRGPQLMMGYWNQPQETAEGIDETPEGRRFHTGDIAFMDADGYVFIVDRLKDMITAGGYKVWPRHVEEALYQHPAIEECVVAGVPDPYRGQTVKAYVKCRAGQTVNAQDLKAFLKERLSPIQIPKLIDFRESLPKTPIGKLSRKLLLDAEKK